MSFEFKDNYTIDDLLEIMRMLRGENGCPWDREQTHQSIRANLIEETYEVIEALDNEDTANLREELGDLLLQIVFHSQMETEIGSFTFADVCDEICKKLIVRHPHVFGDVTAETSDEVLTNWDAIKRSTKGQRTTSEAIDSIARSLPALMRASKVGQKASKAGLDFPDVLSALRKIREECDELEQAILAGDGEHTAEELGDVLFATVNVARLTKTDAELALTHSTDKFAARVALTEQLAAQRGVSLAECDAETFDALWEEAKVQIEGK